MKIVYNSLNGDGEDLTIKQSRVNKREQSAETWMRRQGYRDFLKALKDPEMMELINQVEKFNPDWRQQFLKEN